MRAQTRTKGIASTRISAHAFTDQPASVSTIATCNAHADDLLFRVAVSRPVRLDGLHANPLRSRSICRGRVQVAGKAHVVANILSEGFEVAVEDVRRSRRIACLRLTRRV